MNAELQSSAYFGRKIAFHDSDKVSVIVQNGVVTLPGTVREDWKRVTAGNIVSSVPGVSEVNNGLQVRESVQVA